MREFVQRAAIELGIEVRFEGSGANEVGIVHRVHDSQHRIAPGTVIVRVDPRYYRPTEVETLLGDPSKAHVKLGWTPSISFNALVREMVLADYQLAKRDALVTLAGYRALQHHE